jgi:hypothetical protein
MNYSFRGFSAGGVMPSIGGGRDELNSLKLNFSGPIAGLGRRSAVDCVAVVR